MKNAVFWDVTPCGSLRTDVSGECIASSTRVTRIGELGTTLAVTSKQSRLVVTAYIVPSSLILVNLMMEAILSSETSVLTRAIWRNITLDGILYRNAGLVLVTIIVNVMLYCIVKVKKKKKKKVMLSP
jgi:hypothetical protein